jgi:hypothetical protein
LMVAGVHARCECTPDVRMVCGVVSALLTGHDPRMGRNNPPDIEGMETDTALPHETHQDSVATTRPTSRAWKQQGQVVIVARSAAIGQ